MLQVSDRDIETRLRLDNPWWESGAGIDAEYRDFPLRAYFDSFVSLVRQEEVNRAVVLLGPRRVGKTILVYHTIQGLLDKHVESGIDILYLSLETPQYTGMALDELLDRFKKLFQRPTANKLYVFFDEIQYHKNWEIHLKSLVDTYRDIRFVVTGSAAAALKTKSLESGAGRFTEFYLPPLTFAEYLRFIGRETELVEELVADVGLPRYQATNIFRLNEEFTNYINFGGYPEAVFKQAIRADPRRFIKSDIIDKVLLRDLPSLYGISDIQELNRLFNSLAYNTGQELSLEDLSRSANLAKNTLNRYLEYLEAAFLIRRLRRVDQDAAHFKRATTFKTYLTNPSMRAALFGPVGENDEAMGQLTETAVYSQWLHNAAYVESLYYSRWAKGEVDFVSLDPAGQRPRFAVEVKWSDRAFEDSKEIKGLIEFAKRHTLKRAPLVTTYSKTGLNDMSGITVEFIPASVHCYTVAKNTLERPRI
jgi:uncharacterized protein